MISVLVAASLKVDRSMVSSSMGNACGDERALYAVVLSISVHHALRANVLIGD